MLFVLPTTVLLWLTTNKYLTFWGLENAFIGSIGFWAIFGLFAFISLFLYFFILSSIISIFTW